MARNEEEREKARRQLALDFQKTFDTGSGKKTLEALSKKCRENVATYVDNNTHATAYYEGMRSVIIYIRQMLAKNINEEKQKEAKNE